MDALPTSNPESGYKLSFNPQPSETLHEFCGSHKIQGAICPNCAKPLLRVLTLSAADARLNIDALKTPAIYLLYCWTCSIPFGVFSYRIMDDASVQLLEVPPEYEYAFGPDGPYDGYTGQFPLKMVGLVELTNAEQERQRKAQSDADLALELMPQHHQVGGFPVIANPQKVTCPLCAEASPLLATVCDAASGDACDTDGALAHETFTDNAGTQMVFHFCRNCSVVSAYHSND